MSIIASTAGAWTAGDDIPTPAIGPAISGLSGLELFDVQDTMAAATGTMARGTQNLFICSFPCREKYPQNSGGCVLGIDTSARDLYLSVVLFAEVWGPAARKGSGVYGRNRRSICQAAVYTVNPFVYDYLRLRSPS